MRLILAILFPFTAFVHTDKMVGVLLCLILQPTLLGWPPASIWAVFELYRYKRQQEHEQALDSVNSKI